MEKKEYIRSRKRLFSERNLLIFIAIVPCMSFFIFLQGIPMFYALYLSFHKWTLSSHQFIGLANFAKAFWEDSIFRISLSNTLRFALFVISIGTVLALFFALLINSVQKRKYADIFRSIYFLPVVTSLVACALVWRWLYQPKFGLFNQIFALFGFPRMMWLKSARQALYCIATMSIWKGIGYTIILFLAGLQGIPRSLRESATVDGANRWQILIHIIIPLLMPTITFVIIISTIHALQAFPEMLVMTQVSGTGRPGGGPLYSTRTVVFHLYIRAFDFFQMGYASALSLILFAIILIFTLGQLRLTKTKWEY